MKGFLTRSPDGGITAWWVDEWGYQYQLTGVPAEHEGKRGYAVEVKLKKIPGNLAVPGDEESFEILPT